MSMCLNRCAIWRLQANPNKLDDLLELAVSETCRYKHHGAFLLLLMLLLLRNHLTAKQLADVC